MSEQPALFPMPQEGRTSDDYWTPKWVFDALNVEFDLDVACPPDGPPYTPAKTWYTQETDGLASPWYGNVWMNPPYSNTSPWARKFINHRQGICLVPFAKSKWANELWNDADAVLMMPSTFKFDQGSIFIQTMLAAYGKTNVLALTNAGLGKVR
jgi:phage N-6-adenine-methyltransferase